MNLSNNRKNCGIVWQVLVDWSPRDWQKIIMANDLSYLHYNLEVKDQT
jgi:hypothetical protein